MRNKLKKWLGGLLILGVLPLLAVPHGWAEEDDLDDENVFEITIKDIKFNFEGISISDQIVFLPSGVLVSWLNVDPNITTSGLEGIVPHGVMVKTQDDKIIEKSPLLFQGTDTFRYRFNMPGIYTYQCFVHPDKMKGKILVFASQLNLMVSEHVAAP